MIFDPSLAADTIQRLERRIVDMRRCSHVLHHANGCHETIIELLHGSHQALLSLSLLIVPLKRAVTSSDLLGPVFSVDELAFRAARLVVLTQGPRARELVRTTMVRAESWHSVFDRRVFGMQQEMHSIGLLWTRSRREYIERSGSRERYRAGIEKAWHEWGRLGQDVELIHVLRRASCWRNDDLQKASVALLTVLDIRCFGHAEASFPNMSASALSNAMESIQAGRAEP